jgi:hypothetical protein
MLTVFRRLKEKPESEWKFHELSFDNSPGGFQRELDWAGRYKKRNSDPKQKHEYKIEVINE